MPSNSFLRFLAGTDIFISYRWNDAAKKYALRLSEELEKRGLDCYIDEKGLAGGEDVPKSLQSAIRRSKMFVLLVTDDLLESTWVPQEIAIAKESKRKILPLNVGGGIAKLPLTEPAWAALKNLSRLEESKEALALSVPSQHIPEKIDQAYTSTRRRVLAVRGLFIAGLIFFALSIAAAGSSVYALQIKRKADLDRQTAEKETERLLKQAESLRAEITKAQTDKQVAEADAATARTQKTEAEGLRDQALNAKQTAEIAAKAARDEATKQSQIAFSLNLANRADKLRTEDPGLLEDSVLLGVESVRGINALKVPSAVADRALRTGLDVLPRFRGRIKGTDGEVSFSDDGKYLVNLPVPKTLETGRREDFDPPTTEAATPAPTSKPQTPTDLSDSKPAPATIWDSASLQVVAHLDKRARGHINAVVFSPPVLAAHHYAAAADEGGTIGVWDLTEGKEAVRLQHVGPVYAVSFSPDGQLLASASADTKVKIWRTRDWQQVDELPHQSPVRVVMFSQQSDYLATWDEQNSLVMVWVLGSDSHWQERARFPSPSVSGLYFGPTGNLVVTSAVKQTVVLYDWRQQNSLGSWSGDLGPVTRSIEYNKLKFAFDGASLFLGLKGRLLRIDATDGSVQQQKSFPESLHGEEVFFTGKGKYYGVRDINKPYVRLRYSFDDKDAIIILSETVPSDLPALLGKPSLFSVKTAGRFIATRMGFNQTYIWENPEYLGDKRIATSASGVGLVSFDDDGQHFEVASQTGVTKLRVDSGEEVSTSPFREPIQDSNQFSSIVRQGRFVAFHLVRALTVLDTKTGRAVLTDQPIGSADRAYTFSPDGKHFALPKGDSIHRWRTDTWTQLDPIDGGAMVLSLAFSPDGKLLASGDLGKAHLWDMRTGKELLSIKHDGMVHNIIFSPNGRYIGTASGELEVSNFFELLRGQNPVKNTLILVNEVTTGREVMRVRHGGSSVVLAFSKDSNFLASGGTSQNPTTVNCFEPYIKVWAMNTQKLVAKLEHGGLVRELLFSPESHNLAALSEDGDVRLWSTDDWQATARWEGNQLMHSLSFSPDGKYLATYSYIGETSLWLVKTGDLLDQACERLSRNLTNAEWTTSFGDNPYRRICPKLPEGESCHFVDEYLRERERLRH